MTQYENDIEKVTHLRAQATKNLADLQRELDEPAAERKDPTERDRNELVECIRNMAWNGWEEDRPSNARVRGKLNGLNVRVRGCDLQEVSDDQRACGVLCR